METGKNIQKIAKIVYVVMLIFAILTGIAGLVAGIVMADGDIGIICASAFGAAVVIGLGIFCAWVAKNMISGFGELVENTAAIRENTAK